ncbi:reverse transcriptase-like protein [Candidatus Saccharibacteria bacterium]|nr:reverse transcriptase-like protein [Candidatus Saccharibacteria bacterium]MCL1963093.1 reverse transcriptase-like protein [Candidatus Saccharibacteria bacterium]
MKQKVVIRAVVSHRGRVLLLRRHGGRPEIAGLYELPGGSLHVHEQPVDALKRSLQIHAGIEPDTFRLRDVTSFIDTDDRELQYVFIVYEVGLIGGNPHVTMDDEYDHYVWKALQNIQRNLVTNSTAILLNLGSEQNNSSDLILDLSKSDEKNTTFVIHSDGGSRGNPGPSASAYIIMDNKNNVVAQGGKFLGRNNSGMAEYVGVELALTRALELGIQNIEFYSDNLMVVNQMNGLFSIKNNEYRSIHDRIMRLLPQFRRVIFRHVHREYNRMADALVNKVLDENEQQV